MNKGKFQSWFNRYALIISMLIGAIGHSWFRQLDFLLPTLIFLMLFFTFCKIDPVDLRLRKWHGIVLFTQITLSLGVYYGAVCLLNWLSLFIAISPADMAMITQGAMICIIMPTASAAPIIAGKLGGSIENLTTFTLLSNIATAILVPTIFPIINPAAGIDFLPAMWAILRKVAPLLIAPFLLAWLVRIVYNRYYRFKGTSRTFTLPTKWSSIPFYLWTIMLIILMGKITHNLIIQEYSGWSILVVCIGALVGCIIQFALGWFIGYHAPAKSHGKDYQDIYINPDAANYTIQQKSRITAGQAFGQKNTALGVWMAQAYLTPLADIAPAAYIIWQNLLNSIQLWLAGRAKKPQSKG